MTIFPLAGFFRKISTMMSFKFLANLSSRLEVNEVVVVVLSDEEAPAPPDPEDALDEVDSVADSEPDMDDEEVDP